MDNIQDAIAKKLQAEREERTVKAWYPSKLGMCPTGAYLERLGVKKDKELDERTLRIFSIGKIFENWIVDLIKSDEGKVTVEGGIASSKLILTQEKAEWPEMDAYGYADLVTEDTVWEIKTIHSRGFWHLNKGTKPKEHHAMQLWFYMRGLQKEKGRVVYVSKDDLAIAEYEVLLSDKELEQKVTQELALLNRAWKEKLPPPVTIAADDWRAKYCDYHKQCVSQKEYLKV